MDPHATEYVRRSARLTLADDKTSWGYGSQVVQAHAPPSPATPSPPVSVNSAAPCLSPSPPLEHGSASSVLAFSAATSGTPSPKPPPRPSNAFILYRSDVCARFAGLTFEKNRAKFSKVVGHMWNKESKEIRMQYEEKARLEKEAHNLRYPGYVYTPHRRTNGPQRQPKRVVAKDKAKDALYMHAAVLAREGKSAHEVDQEMQKFGAGMHDEQVLIQEDPATDTQRSVRGTRRPTTLRRSGARKVTRGTRDAMAPSPEPISPSALEAKVEPFSLDPFSGQSSPLAPSHGKCEANPEAFTYANSVQTYTDANFFYPNNLDESLVSPFMHPTDPQGYLAGLKSAPDGWTHAPADRSDPNALYNPYSAVGTYIPAQFDGSATNSYSTDWNHLYPSYGSGILSSGNATAQVELPMWDQPTSGLLSRGVPLTMPPANFHMPIYMPQPSAPGDVFPFGMLDAEGRFDVPATSPTPSPSPELMQKSSMFSLEDFLNEDHQSSLNNVVLQSL